MDILAQDYSGLDLSLEAPSVNSEVSGASNEVERVQMPKDYFRYVSPSLTCSTSSLYQCLLECPKSKKLLSCANNSRCNLKRHIDVYHPSRSEDFGKKCKELNKRKSPLDETDAADNEDNEEPAEKRVKFLTQTEFDDYTLIFTGIIWSRSQFQQDSESSLKHCKPLAAEILSSVERRFDHLFDDDDLRIASFCHPKFKYYWISEEETEAAEDLFRSQYEKFKSKLERQPINGENNVINVIQEGPEKNSEKENKDYFNSLKKKKLPSEKDEVTLFMENSCESLTMLDCYPIVKEMFLSTNAALPSSAACERLFSLAGRIFTPTRNRLSDKVFEMLLFIRNNAYVIN